MNETLLIILGVSVFAMTVAGVLIYFFSLVNGLTEDAIEASEATTVQTVAPQN